MMLNQVNNHVVDRAGLHVHLGVTLNLVRNVRALIRFLLRKKFCIHQQAVLEIINAQLRRLAKSN